MGAPAGHIATAGTNIVLPMDENTATKIDRKNHHARAVQGGLNRILNETPTQMNFFKFHFSYYLLLMLQYIFS